MFAALRRQLRVISCLALFLLGYFAINFSGDLYDFDALSYGDLKTLWWSDRPLQPLSLETLPLGSIKPTGWLHDQLQSMGNGLGGHLYEFYEYVQQSSWLGGDKEYSGLNEGFPYWFNGMVPLAYGLDDERLKAQVHTAASYVLKHQTADGWLGPEVGGDRLLWARFPLSLGLMQLAQANSTWTGSILDSLHRFAELMHDMLSHGGSGYSSQGSGNWSAHMLSWGRVRGHDMILVLQWLHERDEARNRKLLFENMRMLHDLGLRWEDWYTPAYLDQSMDEDSAITPESVQSNYHFQHGVNVAQGLKAAAVIQRFTHDKKLLQTAYNGVNWTLQYHGSPSGTIIADERIGGLSPFAGSELCTSVELLYSLSYLYHSTGDRYFADLAELTAFNSVPVMMTADSWAHQYVTATNQPNAVTLTHPPFYNTNGYSQTFGLEPHYPCCTVNHVQGLPKYLSHSWTKVGANGIAHALLGPGTAAADLSSGKVTIEANTMYPYSDAIQYDVHAEGSFEFHIRVPSWASHASRVTIDGSTESLMPDERTGLHLMSLPAGQSKITYQLDATLRTKPRANETINVYYGALLYALEIRTSNTSTLPRQFRHPEHFHDPSSIPPEVKDYQLHAISAWNYAIDPSTLMYEHGQPESDRSIWTSDGGFRKISVQGCQIEWPVLEQSPTVPGYPPVGDAKQCSAAPVELNLIPYASAKAHMAEIPIIRLS